LVSLLVSANEIYENYSQPLVVFDIRFTQIIRLLFPITEERNVKTIVELNIPSTATEHNTSSDKQQNLTLNWIK
jgi:hypothetical protein